tara:strand:- start:5491 stop:5784 length:294 start_codon:yes stop_codon:yes gene_type:complete
MYVHVFLGILSLASLLLSLLLLGRLQRLETAIQTSIAVQLDLGQRMLSEITGDEMRLSIRQIDPDEEQVSTPKSERFSLQSEIDRFVTERRYAEEDD